MHLDLLLLDTFLVFCRIGACFMVVPGISTAAVPVRFRLYIAGAVAFTIAPIIGSERTVVGGGEHARLIISELLAGLMIGMAARLLIEGLEFAGSAISSLIGLSWLSGGIDGGEPQPTLATLIGVFGAYLLMVMEFPQHVVAALVESYVDIPRGGVPNSPAMLRHLTNATTAAFVIGLQLSSPFLIYGLVANAMFGILGKIVPQVPAYFISAPFIMLGGLALLYLVSAQIIHVVIASLESVLMN